MEFFNRQNKESDTVDITQIAEGYCEKIIDSTKLLEESKKEYKLTQSYLSDIQKIEMLPTDQYNYLISLAKKVTQIEKDKTTYKSAINKLTQEQYNYIHLNEDKMSQTIRDIEQEEKKLQMLKGNMNYLEGEKSALKEEQQEYKNRLYLIQGISKISIAFLFLVFLILMVAKFYFSINTILYVYIAIVVAILLTLTIFMSNRKTLYELKLTEVKMNKAISLLNKAKLQYVNAMAGLDFSYEKNQVASSMELNSLWKQYLKQKQNKQVYQQTSNMLYNVSEEYLDLLNRYAISDANAWFERMEILINEKKREEKKVELSKKLKSIKENMKQNEKIIEQSKTKVKDLAKIHEDYADEILKLIGQYGDLL